MTNYHEIGKVYQKMKVTLSNMKIRRKFLFSMRRIKNLAQ